MVPLEKINNKVIQKEDLAKLFSNVKELLDITYSVLNTMEQRKRKKENGGKYVVGDVFLKLVRIFFPPNFFKSNYSPKNFLSIDILNDHIFFPAKIR